MKLKKLVAATAVSLLAFAPASFAATVDLGFAIDESGSVFSGDFVLARDGLAAALGSIPTDDPDVTYRISVVKFDGTVETVVPVTVLDSPAALNTVVGQIQGATQQGGSTAIGDAIAALTMNFTNAGGFGDTSLFNVTTDGANNTGSSISASATAAANAGLTGLSYEAVGLAAIQPLLDTAFPTAPVLVTDAANLPDPTKQGFVFEVDSFADYAAAISSKVQTIVDNTGGGGTPDPDPLPPIPLPAGMPLLLGGLGVLALVRRRAKA